MKNAGKDTVGSYLIEKYGFQQLSFANSLKDALCCIFKWPRNMIEGSTPESRVWRETIDPFWGITPRYALEHFGTNLCRKQFDQNIWIKSLEKQLLMLPDDARVVITDCRFENEIAMIHNLGGTLIRVQRPPFPEWISIVEDLKQGNMSLSDAEQHLYKTNIHETEWRSHLLSRDFNEHMILNDTSIEELMIKVEEVFSKLDYQFKD